MTADDGLYEALSSISALLTSTIALPTIGQTRRLLADMVESPAIEGASARRAVTSLMTPLLYVGRDLASWLAVHEPWGELALTIRWGQTVIVEVSDHGSILPDPETSRADAQFAEHLLAGLVVEWSAEETETGRRIWAALPVARHHR